MPVPARLASRPRDARGFPVPAFALVRPDGTPDFRVTDVKAWERAARMRTCSLCAEPLGRHLAFVGGPLSHQNRLFLDLPMHRDCAEYALQVCPFLAAPRFAYAEADKVHVEGVHVQTSEVVSLQRPEVFWLGITTNYKLTRLPDGTIAAKAEPWTESVPWKDGQRLQEGSSATDAKAMNP